MSNPLLLSGSGFWNPSRLAFSDIVAAWSANGAISSGGAVSSAAAWGPISLTNQEGSSLQPTLSGGRIVFDNTRSTFLSANRLPRSTSTTLPNGGTGSTSGKGFTCTGIVLDTTDGTWWAGNYGIPAVANVGSVNFAASIIHLSADFSTILSQITLGSLGITQDTTHTGPQGVTIDTSNNTIWFACPEVNILYNVSKTGTLINSLANVITAVGGFGVNGLTYDPGADQLVVMLSGNSPQNLSWINKTTGAVIKTVAVTSGLLGSDHLFIDPNDPGYIYADAGLDATSTFSTVLKVKVSDGSIAAHLSLVNCDAIEGIYLSNGTLYVMNDAFFHDAELNQVLTYTVPAQSNLYPSIGNRYQIFGTASIPASLGTSHCLICLGNFTLGGLPGAGLYFPASSTSALRFLTGAPGTVTAFDTSVTTTTPFLFFFDINTSAQGMNVYINGLLVSSVSIASASSPTLGNVPICVGAAIDEGQTTSLTRFSNVSVGNIGVCNFRQDSRELIEGWCAWDAGLQSLLPSQHQYKSKAP